MKTFLECYLPIVSTALGGTLVVLAASRIIVDMSKGKQRAEGSGWMRMGRASGVEKETKSNRIAAGVGAASGLSLYVLGRELWRRGPLRGGLSVFGASPQLDRCASQERYLAEKLAELSHAVIRGVAPISRLSQLQVHDQAIAGAVGAVTSYAKQIQSASRMLLAPELNKAWTLFSARVVDHQQEMRGLADKIYYPSMPGAEGGQASTALRVVNATEPVRRFARSSGDCAEVFKWLMKELGSSSLGTLQAVFNACLVGVAVGCELEPYVPADFDPVRWLQGVQNDAAKLLPGKA